VIKPNKQKPIGIVELRSFRRLIRDAVGPDTNLMVDINQRWGVHEAISIGRPPVMTRGLTHLPYFLTPQDQTDPRLIDYQPLHVPSLSEQLNKESE
jgi:hypothetical protein